MEADIYEISIPAVFVHCRLAFSCEYPRVVENKGCFYLWKLKIIPFDTFLASVPLGLEKSETLNKKVHVFSFPLTQVTSPPHQYIKKAISKMKDNVVCAWNHISSGI